MFKQNFLAGMVVLFSVLAPSAYAGKVELTTFYPSTYGEYTNLKSTGDSSFATTSGSVGIGTTSPGATLHVVGAAIIPGLIGQIQTVSPAADTTITSASFVDFNGMSITLTTKANSKLLIFWNAGIYEYSNIPPSYGYWAVTQAQVDGVTVGTWQGGAYNNAGNAADSMGGNAVATVSTAGSHTVKIQWRVSSTNATAGNYPTSFPTVYGRILTVVEVYQ